MFQTEIIIFIQSFSSDFLTFFFKFWTTIGYPSYITVFLIIILFGIKFREGFILIHAVLWTTIITTFLKNLFALPRPANVDLNVKLLGESYPNLTPFESTGAENFWGRLPKEVVEALRIHPIDSWGFPSGHTSNAAATWGLLAMMFKKKWIRIVSIGMIVFIPFSRMYLGRHFLADIMGGYLIGWIMAFVFYGFVFRNRRVIDLFYSTSSLIKWNRKIVIFLVYLFLLPFLLLFVPHIPADFIAILLGLNVGFLIIWRKGIPKDDGSFIQRTVRAFIAIGFYFGTDQGLEATHRLFFQSEPEVASLLRMALTAFFLMWGSTELSIKLGLFKQES